MQNDTPENDKSLPPEAEDDDVWSQPTGAGDGDGDRTVIGGTAAPATDEEDKTQLAAPPVPVADEDRTLIAEAGAPTEAAPADEDRTLIADAGVPVPDALEPDTGDEASAPPSVDLPPQTDIPVDPPAEEAAENRAPSGVQTPPDVADATAEAEIATPPEDGDKAPDDSAIAAPPQVEADDAGVAVPPLAPEVAAEDAADLATPPEDLPPSDPPAPAAPEVTSDDVGALPEGTGPASGGGDAGPVPVGTMINNNYEIKEMISAGGMGEVFRGENAFTGDAVAIKIVLQSLANDPKIAALFMREAKVLCGLSDQAIVRYFNFVKDADLDRFCLIMEFISGVSLSDFVRDERPLTEDEARGLMRRVASGLEKAHQMEVVHRDLSPDNVMLRDGKVSDAVLIDFGIAKSTEMAENTLHGQLAGKFKYISPEQLGHFGGEIGPRTDIYGLGLLMAAALRGEPLDMGASVVEAVNARREIPDLSDVTEGLRPLIAHMLEPDPAHRPARMSDVIRLLDFPQDIPAKYGGARPVAEGQTVPPGVPQPIGGVSTPGLQQPPGQQGQPTGTMGAPSFVPAGGTVAPSASPFGAQTAAPPGTFAPPGTYAPGVTAAPGHQTMSGTASRRRDREGGGFFRWFFILLVLIAIGGFVAYNQGLIPEEYLPDALRTAEADPEDADTDPVADTPAGPMTRGRFLATYDAGDCSFASRVAAGRDAGTVQAFAADPGGFDGLTDAFEAAFGARPTVQARAVPDTHCAALDMAENLAITPGSPPVLTLDSNEMQSGGSIVGRLSDRRGRPVWLVLITAAGGVYNLSDRVTEQADGSATFSFGLNSDGSGEAQPQLIMAVASDQPLIAAAAANNGARASELLPLIEAEIASRQGEAGAALAYFDLLP